MAEEGGREQEEAIVRSALDCPHCRGAKARPGGGARLAGAPPRGSEDGGAGSPAAHPARAPARAAPRRRPLLSRQPRLSPRALGLPRAPGTRRIPLPTPARVAPAARRGLGAALTAAPRR